MIEKGQPAGCPFCFRVSESYGFFCLVKAGKICYIKSSFFFESIIKKYKLWKSY